MTETPLRVSIIIGSTREGRIGDRVGGWFAAQASRRTDLAVSVLDLVAYDFPARLPARATGAVARFVGEVGRAEAFIVVTPEYNHSFPASLKQAIDYAYDEWRAKPVGLVSYGCSSRGLYAAEHLRAVFTALHAVTMPDGMCLDILDCPDIGGAGPLDEEAHRLAFATLLDRLCWWGVALRDARAARPYVS